MRARTIGAGRTSDVGDPLRAAVFSWDPALYGYLSWDVHHFAPADKHARAVLGARIETVINEHSDPGEGRFPTTPLEEFLDLPVWKHRSKIYCIWLVSVVARVFTHSGKFELCGEDGALVFAFAETRIARIRWNGIVMQLIAELRTPAGAAELTGKGRIENIQPDYVLRRTDVSPASTLYVLEAKQYGKPSLQNFARSLRDYAVVHTNALVGLANYGPVSAKIAQTVAALAIKMKDANLTSRCAAFGNVEPTFPQSIDALCDHLRRSLPDIVVDPPTTLATLIVDVSQSMVAVLPPHEEHTDLWRKLDLSGLPILFAAGGFQMEISGYQGSNFGHEICRHRQHSAFAMPQIPPNRREGSIFLTDASGYTETSEFHGTLAAIIVLGLNRSARLYINLAYWDLMVVMFASLLTSSAITASVYS